MFEIYLIINQINEKVYVGKTSSGRETRWKQHLYNASTNAKNFHLSSALRKYGSKNFTLSLLEEAGSGDEADACEIKWIDFFKSRNREFGYNMTAGGDGAKVLREESIQKMKDFASERFSKPENIPWYRSDIADEEVVRLYQSGKTILSISKEMGVAFSTINERLKKSNILRRGKKIPLDSKQLVALYRAGNTSAEIGLVFSVSKTCVVSRLKKLQEPIRQAGARIKHGRYRSKKEIDLESYSEIGQMWDHGAALPGVDSSSLSQCTSSALAE